MSRFNDDVVANTAVLSLKESRAAVQRQAYEAWNNELRRKYRNRLDQPAEEGYQDLTNLEHLATQEDLDRLNELLAERYEALGLPK